MKCDCKWTRVSEGREVLKRFGKECDRHSEELVGIQERVMVCLGCGGPYYECDCPTGSGYRDLPTPPLFGRRYSAL